MTLRKVDLFVWPTTPGELRRLANRLEQNFQKATLGDPVPSLVVYGEAGVCELRITIDQEAMYEEEKETKR